VVQPAWGTNGNRRLYAATRTSAKRVRYGVYARYVRYEEISAGNASRSGSRRPVIKMRQRRQNQRSAAATVAARWQQKVNRNQHGMNRCRQGCCSERWREMGNVAARTNQRHARWCAEAYRPNRGARTTVCRRKGMAANEQR